MSLNDFPTDHRAASGHPHLKLIAEHDDVVGAAVDILATRHQVSADQASDLLVAAGENTQRAPEDVAEEVVLLGLTGLSGQTELRAGASTEADIAARLLDLLAISTTTRETLQGIADLAVEIVPDVDCASLTVIRDRTATTVSANDVWHPAASREGLTATVSMPIPAAPDIDAELNLHTGRRTDWPQSTLDVAETLATYAGDAVTVAYRFAR